MNEADTCRTYVVPKLQASGWDSAPYSIAEQRTFTNPKGRVRIVGGTIVRGKPKRADYILRYRPDFPIAVVEAKADYKTPGAGLGQAKDYATLLGLKFAYSTNGTGIVEFDFTTGLEKPVDAFPSPQDLWARLRLQAPLAAAAQEKLISPNHPDPERPPRYYQQIAINRALEAILRGQQRILIAASIPTNSCATSSRSRLWTFRRRLRPSHAASQRSAATRTRFRERMML